jgi:Polysaccharide pyruvyl transferase
VRERHGQPAFGRARGAYLGTWKMITHLIGDRFAPGAGNHGEAILVAWWGALNRGGPTIGDYLSLRSVVAHLAANDHNVVVAAPTIPLAMPCAAVDWESVDPAAVTYLVFVCGPVIAGSQALRDLFSRFGGCAKVGVGVSILPPSSPDHWMPFDICLARDGLPRRHFDVALAASLAAPSVPCQRADGLRVGVARRGAQREYGLGACRHEMADATIERLVARLGIEAVLLETRLDIQSESPEALEAAFDSVDLVITTRLHGALLALRHGIPTVVLDQIAGGGKVTAAMRHLGWPYVYPVEAGREEELERAVWSLLQPGGRGLALRAGKRARRYARHSLRVLGLSLRCSPRQVALGR